MFRKISISVKLSKIFDFGENFEKFRFRFSKKFRYLVKCSKNFRTKFSISVKLRFRKISISVRISKNFDFGQNFRKISILVKFSNNFVKIFDSNQNFEKISILVKFFDKFRFWSENFDFGQFKKISIVVFSKKNRKFQI